MKTKILRWIVQSSCVVFLAVASARAAVIHLKNGSDVRGTVVSATAGDMQIQTAQGLQTIATDQIVRIDYLESVQQPMSKPSLTLIDPVRRQMFSLGLGLAAPLGRVDFASTGGGTASNGNAGILLDTQYGYALTRHLSAGANVEFMNRTGGDTQSLLPESNTDVFGNSLVLMATLKYSPADRAAVRPYILGGLGTNRTSTIIEATPNEGFAWSDSNTGETRTLVDDTHWGFASTLRAGIDFLYADPYVFSMEIGWTRLSNKTYTATQAGRDVGLESVTGNQDVLVFGLRWGWRF